MFVYYLIAAVIVGIDQITKYLTVQHIPLYETIEFIPGVVSWTYIQNDGAAWSILEGKMVFFYIITAIVTGVVIYYLHQYAKGEPLFAISLAFILGGTLGNFIDRLHLQYVVDMIRLDFVHFPIFNVADSALTIGVLLLLLYVFLDEKEEKKSKKKN
ncbi:signal peptidase II [Pisciglobus halotolerans]|uniref:Lipoprotein signal peptidase n=1 Tax=Pisciglobus halotolerans TaxID=745365 RepID=A0A1I3BB71_9LACT|nr:signal peptidase II [Pisciglobus halotolerans]SFH59420.1 signal peptidase II Aspartic peptidase. MEROPS family A08 [Pisciglobus halotolerans]